MAHTEVLTILGCDSYYGFEELESFIFSLSATKELSQKLLLALPISYLEKLKGKQENENFILGAADFAGMDPKNFAAPITQKLLEELGVKFVMLETFRLPDFSLENLREQLLHALKLNLIPIVCLHAEESLLWPEQLTIIGKEVSFEKLASIVIFCRGGDSFQQAFLYKHAREAVEKSWSLPVAQRIKIIGEVTVDTCYIEQRWQHPPYCDGIYFRVRELKPEPFEEFFRHLHSFIQEKDALPKIELEPLPKSLPKPLVAKKHTNQGVNKGQRTIENLKSYLIKKEATANNSYVKKEKHSFENMSHYL